MMNFSRRAGKSQRAGSRASFPFKLGFASKSKLLRYLTAAKQALRMWCRVVRASRQHTSAHNLCSWQPLAAGRFQFDQPSQGVHMADILGGALRACCA